MTEEKDPDIRIQKDLKVLKSHIYECYEGDTTCLHIQVMDRKTGKVYAGNISKTYDKLEDWKNEN